MCRAILFGPWIVKRSCIRHWIPTIARIKFSVTASRLQPRRIRWYTRNIIADFSSVWTSRNPVVLFWSPRMITPPVRFTLSMPMHRINRHNSSRHVKRILNTALSDHGEQWFITTNADGCEDYKIMTTDLNNTVRAHWQDYYLPAAGTLLKGIFLFKDYLVRSERVQGLPRIIVQPFAKDTSPSSEYAIEFWRTGIRIGNRYRVWVWYP